MPSEIPVSVKGNADLSPIETAIMRLNRRAGDLNTELAKIPGALAKIASQSLGQLQHLTTSSLTGGAMYGRISGGLNDYKQHVIELDNEARAVKNLGQAYSEYRRQVIDAGRSYGFGNDDVVGLAGQLSRATGRAGASQLTDTMRASQGFSRAYGMSASEGGSVFADAATSGITSGGGDVSPRQFAALIAESVAGGGMGGREREVIGSIQDLSRVMNRQVTSVQGTQLATSLLTTLNQTGVRGLQGQAGASLLGQLNQGIMNPGGGEAGDLFMYRSLQGGQNTGMGLGDYRYLQEEGLAGQGPNGKSNVQNMLEGVNGLGLSDKYKLMAGSQITGLSMHQYEAVQNAFMKDGQFQTAKMGALQDRLGPQGMQGVDVSTWGMLAELAQKPDDGANTAAVAKEYEQLSGKKAISTSDSNALFQQIQGYGQGNVAMSEGQSREKLDADISKAAEDAGAKLYDLQTAADKAALALLKIGGDMPGPLGGIAPIALGSAAGGLLNYGTGALTKGAGKLLGRLPGIGGGAGAGGAAAGAEGAGAAGTAAGGGFLSGAATFLGGIGLGAGAAWGGSLFAEHALGKESFATAIGVAGSNVGAMMDGTSGVGIGDVGNAVGAIGMAVPGTVAGLVAGTGSALMGGDFSDTYDNTFFGINRFDSVGRQQWQAAQGQDPMTGLMRQIKSGQLTGSALGQALRQVSESTGNDTLLAFTRDIERGNTVDTQQLLGALSKATGKAIPSSRGGWWDVPTDEQPALLHRQEMVLPADLAQGLRQTVQQGQGGGRGAMRIEPITINLTMPDGSRQTVRAQARFEPFAGVINQPYRGTE